MTVTNNIYTDFGKIPFSSLQFYYVLLDLHVFTETKTAIPVKLDLYVNAIGDINEMDMVNLNKI